jgi:hypothetical protein
MIKRLALAAAVSLTALGSTPATAATATPDTPDCVTDYKLCRDNSDLIGNWEWQGKPGMTVRFLCLREAERMGHKGVPPYAFSEQFLPEGNFVGAQKIKGRDFVDNAVVRLTNHGLTCVIDLDAESISLTADATADAPWCRDDYRVCADNNEVADHYMVKDVYAPLNIRNAAGDIVYKDKGIPVEAACQEEAKRRGYGDDVDFAYYTAPGRTWIDTGIARLPENADPSGLLCLFDLRTGLVKSITVTGPRSLKAG